VPHEYFCETENSISAQHLPRRTWSDLEAGHIEVNPGVVDAERVERQSGETTLAAANFKQAKAPKGVRLALANGVAGRCNQGNQLVALAPSLFLQGCAVGFEQAEVVVNQLPKITKSLGEAGSVQVAAGAWHETDCEVAAAAVQPWLLHTRSSFPTSPPESK
jgi:hypothetical protein